MPVDTAEELYGLPLERFVPERAALVKVMRADGRREEASRIAALRKPSIAAWAVNQLVRTQGKPIQALLAAGDLMAAAASGGKDGAAKLRQATAELRAALATLTAATEELLSSDGQPLTPATIDKALETLRAAALDPVARTQVEAGCLTRQLQYAGFGLGDGSPGAPARATASADSSGAVSDDEAAQEAERVHERRRREAERADAGAALERAQDQAGAAKATLAKAQEERTAAARALARADQRLAKATATVARASDQLAAAEQRLAELR